MTKKQKKILIRIIITVFLIIACLLLPLVDFLRFLAFMIPYLVIGYDILLKAFKGILRGQVFDENFLMAIATLGAVLLGEYTEATAVMLFYQIGELFQGIAVGKSRRNIKALMDITPDFANLILDDGTISVVSPYGVSVGNIIAVKQGERVPIDGVVIDGETSLDTSALTGESLPREISIDDEIFSGCINLDKVIKVRTTKKYEDSTVAKILELIENSGARKSRSEKFISKFAKYYTPIVCCSSLALAILPPLFIYLLSGELILTQWIYRALTFLVISCPCALVISIPLTFFSTIGGAGRSGILIKGSNYIETLAKAKYVVFDKTGTLTKGSFRVVDIISNDFDKDKLIEYAALCEIYSNHPISLCIRNSCNIPLDASRVSDVNEISGLGINAVVDGVCVSVGNIKLMSSMGIDVYEKSDFGNAVHVAIDGSYKGSILISDEIKETSKETIEKLSEMGIKRTVMLSGDKQSIAASVADKLALDEAYGALMPADKVMVVENLINELKGNEKLIFVGDGINDAPVLARADVGVSMGALGSASAIEASDVVLMDDDPLKLVKAIKISKKCLAIVYQNIYFSLGVKLACLVLGAWGIANMWTAIFADVGVMVIAVLNAVRALNVKKL